MRPIPRGRILYRDNASDASEGNRKMPARNNQSRAQSSRTERLAEQLHDRAASLKPGDKLPTFRELCLSYGVSKATLDHALRELENRGQIERRQGSGIYVARTFGQKTVGVVLGTNIMRGGFSPFWGLLLQASRNQLMSRRYRFHSYLDFPQGNEFFAAHVQLENDLKAGRLDGLLAIAETTSEGVRWLSKWGVPVVTVPTPRTQQAWNVTLKPMTDLAVAELARIGCRHIALLSITDAAIFSHALQQAALECSRELLWTPRDSGQTEGWRNFEEYGYLTAAHCWRRAAHRIDGLVITDDTMARGAMMALYKLGVDIGRDVNIAVGVNKGSPVLAPYDSDLILLEYDPDEVLASAVDMLDTLMNGALPPVNPIHIAPHVRRPGGEAYVDPELPSEPLTEEDRHSNKIEQPAPIGVKGRFTLIELLVVVAIIAVLASLLLPALKRSRERAQMTMCMANQRQTAIAWNAYAGDNNDWYPSCEMSPNTPTPWDYRAWYYFTMHDDYDMLDALFVCPMSGITDYEAYAGWTWAGDPRGNYRGVGQGEFYTWIQRTGWGTYPNASVAGPSRTTDSTERMQNPILAEAAMADTYGGSLADHPGTIYAASHRQNGKLVNMTEVWADGHVQLVPGSEVTLKFPFAPWNAWY